MGEDYLDFDDVLPLAGEFGTYQWCLFFSMALFCLNLVFVYFMQFFMTLVPDHWCLVPDLLQANISLDLRRNLSIPMTVNSEGIITRAKCEMYDVDYKELLEGGVVTANTSWPVVSCDRWEWDISTSGHYHTIVSELGWVCDKEWYGTLAQSVFFLGAIVGGVVCGWAADKYGRVPVLVATNVVGAIASLLTPLAWSLPEFLIYRFIIGIAFDNIFVMMYVLAIEYVGPKHRTLVANLSIALFYATGTVLLPWMMIGVGDWRLMSVISSAPMILACASHWLLPESARWLLSQGRVEETIEILERIARINRKIIPPKVIDTMKKNALQERVSSMEGDLPLKEMDVSLLDLLKTPRLRRTTIVICLVWMIIALEYDGHVRNVLNLPIDVFIAFTVACASELPADVFLVLTLDKWGRRWYLFIILVLSGVFSILTTAFEGNTIIIASLAIMGRFCINVAFNIGLQYASELLPTVVRAQSVAFVHIMGYVAGLLSPLVVFLGTLNPFIPLVILGLASIVGGCLALLLPETLHRDLPQTMSDGENFGIDQSFCYWPCARNQEEPSVPSISLGELGHQPSFIRHRPRPSVRGETYRSSLIKHRREVVYIPPVD